MKRGLPKSEKGLRGAGGLGGSEKSLSESGGSRLEGEEHMGSESEWSSKSRREFQSESEADFDTEAEWTMERSVSDTSDSASPTLTQPDLVYAREFQSQPHLNFMVVAPAANHELQRISQISFVIHFNFCMTCSSLILMLSQTSRWSLKCPGVVDPADGAAAAGDVCAGAVASVSVLDALRRRTRARPLRSRTRPRRHHCCRS